MLATEERVRELDVAMLEPLRGLDRSFQLNWQKEPLHYLVSLVDWITDVVTLTLTLDLWAESEAYLMETRPLFSRSGVYCLCGQAYGTGEPASSEFQATQS